jgi:hypothetical protein
MLIWSAVVLLAVALLTKAVDSILVSASQKNPALNCEDDSGAPAPVSGKDSWHPSDTTGVDGEVILQAAMPHANDNSLCASAWIEQERSHSLSADSLVSSSVATSDGGWRAFATDVD